MITDTYEQVLPYDSAMTSLGRLAGAGFIRRKTGYLPWRVLGSYAVVYVLEGQGRFQDAGGFAQDVTAGDLLLLFPEVAHRYGPGRRGEWTEFHLIFEGSAFDFWREAGVIHLEQPVYALQPVSDWLNRLLSVADRSDLQTAGGRLVSVSRLLTVLAEIAATREEEETHAGVLPWLDRARHLLESDLSQAISPGSVAAQIGLSYETFRKGFEQQTGISPARFRADKRLGAAQALLRHTQMTSRQIADSLGFHDEFYFSRWFKQRVSLSPRDFRRQQVPDPDK